MIAAVVFATYMLTCLGLSNFATTPAGLLGRSEHHEVACALDKCSLPGICSNGGSCFQDSLCRPVCRCLSPFSGIKCENTVRIPSQAEGSQTSTIFNGKMLNEDSWSIDFGLNNTDESSQLEPSAPVCPNSECNNGYCTGTGVKCQICPASFLCLNGYCLSKGDPAFPIFQCECYEGFGGGYCQHVCSLDCGMNGTCIYRNESAVCNCDGEFLPGNCTVLKPQTTTPQPIRLLLRHTPDWIYIVVGTTLTVLFGLIFVVLILGYYMWKKRYMFVLKIIHFFKGYEDDDGKLFDAFVSFKSTPEDERFVVHTLYPKLEKELNFKLCLHFRDFLPGETIANNILWAVDNSRRTILLLSPSYVESEFCRMEYQAAQHEMLKLKHKIIPVMYKDISHMKSDMDPTLKSVLNSVTYLEWPEEEAGIKKLDHFWNKLSLSLPKKKVHESPSLDTQISTTASTVGLTSSFTDNVPMEKETKQSDEYKLNIISMSDIDLENKSSSKKYKMTTKKSKNNVNLQRYEQSLNC